jgi:cytochrome c556
LLLWEVAIVVRLVVALIAGWMMGLSPAVSDQVVPGPFGNIVDHQKPLVFKDEASKTRYVRQQAMRAFSAHFRSVEAVVSYNAPFDALLSTDADALARLGDTLSVLFAANEPMELGKHGARPEIWQKPARFVQHIEGFRAAAGSLQQSIADKRPLAGPLLAVRHQCLACHQSFRVFAPRN